MQADHGSVKRRLRIIAGHIQAVERMVEEDKYCMDIIHQTQAIKRALDRVEEELLNAHLATCVTTALHGEDVGERERVVQELMELFSARNKL